MEHGQLYDIGKPVYCKLVYQFIDKSSIEILLRYIILVSNLSITINKDS